MTDINTVETMDMRESKEMIRACKHGPNAKVEDLLKKGKKLSIDLVKIISKRCNDTVCARGHLFLAKWLKENWPDIDHRAEDDIAFRSACKNGHLDVAKWLKDNWLDIDHRAKHDWAFRSTCVHGHLEVAKWLKGN